MTGEISKFHKLDEKVTGHTQFGDGSKINIQGKCSILFDCQNGDQKLLDKVYYIPRLKINIISLGQLTEDGYQVDMDGDILRIFDTDNTLPFKVKRSSNRIYKTILRTCHTMCLAPTQDDNGWLWHARNSSKEGEKGHLCHVRHEVKEGEKGHQFFDPDKRNLRSQDVSQKKEVVSQKNKVVSLKKEEASLRKDEPLPKEKVEDMVEFSDNDFGGDKTGDKHTSEISLYIKETNITWQSQRTVTLSILDFMTANAMECQIVWLVNLLVKVTSDTRIRFISEYKDERQVTTELLKEIKMDIFTIPLMHEEHGEMQDIFELQREQAELMIKAFQSVYIPGSRFFPTKDNKRMKEIDREANTRIGKHMPGKKFYMSSEIKDQIVPVRPVEKILRVTDSSVIQVDHERGDQNGTRIHLRSRVSRHIALPLGSRLLLGPKTDQRRVGNLSLVFGIDGLSHLKVINMIFNEVLRLYPPAVSVRRMIHEETKLGNLTLPAGTLIQLNILFLHHDKDMWGKDVNEFKPERFSEGVSKATKGQTSYIPFGGGPRICIGQNFAMLEAKMALAMILQSFYFELSASYSHAPHTIITLQPQFGAGRSRWNDNRRKNGEGYWYANRKGASTRNGAQARGGEGGWTFNDATSFFISNLPKNCEESELWQPMRELGTVVDIFIIKNRLDKHGCRFGFVRFNRVSNVSFLENEINGTKIDGRCIFARVAKFARPAKDSGGSYKQTNNDMDKKGVQESRVRNNVSYAEATNGGTSIHNRDKDGNVNPKKRESDEYKQPQTKVLEINLGRKLTPESIPIRMVGMVKNVHALNSIYNVFRGEGYGKSSIDYMGGLWILINLPTSDEKEKLMKNQELRSCGTRRIMRQNQRQKRDRSLKAKMKTKTIPTPEILHRRSLPKKIPISHVESFINGQDIGIENNTIVEESAQDNLGNNTIVEESAQNNTIVEESGNPPEIQSQYNPNAMNDTHSPIKAQNTPQKISKSPNRMSDEIDPELYGILSPKLRELLSRGKALKEDNKRRTNPNEGTQKEDGTGSTTELSKNEEEEKKRLSPRITRSQARQRNRSTSQSRIDVGGAESSTMAAIGKACGFTRREGRDQEIPAKGTKGALNDQS
ncbi:hypothetical protein LXL04_022362 [Taraxacum kok-saghyz]